MCFLVWLQYSRETEQKEEENIPEALHFARNGSGLRRLRLLAEGLADAEKVHQMLCLPHRQRAPFCGHPWQRQILPYCCWMRSLPIWMPRRRPVCGRPCVRPPVGVRFSPFPTASMRVLAAGLWRSGPKDSKCRECSPGSRKTSGAAKCWGKKRLTASMGSVMMNRGRRDLFQPSTEVNVHG